MYKRRQSKPVEVKIPEDPHASYKTSYLFKETLKEVDKDGSYPDTFKIDDSAVICKKAIVNGVITIGANTIIHPAALVRGNIEIGSNCMIEEGVQIVGSGNEKVVIGDDNHFEVGAICSGTVGNGNVIQHKAKIAAGVEIGNGCFIGIRVELKSGEKISDNTSVYGQMQSQRKLDSSTAEANAKAILPKIELAMGQIEKAKNNKNSSK